MKDILELAGGSVTGRDHVRVGKNNQDAYSWRLDQDSAIAVVCDGCGSGTHSEVGAKLGVRIVVATLQQAVDQNGLTLDTEEVWSNIQQDWLTRLHQWVVQLGGDRGRTIQDYLLFTIAGVVITPATTTIFALGDGVIAINGAVMRLGPFANNAPPYLAYDLLAPVATNPSMQLRIVQRLPTDHLESLLIGSDGVGDLIQVANQSLPGRTEPVGEIGQFWQDDRYFRNPDQVRRRLALINREVTILDNSTHRYLKQPGLLPDDTTLISIRKRQKGD